MLTRLRLRDFKAWKDSGEVRLAPLTVLFGANSAGKSSLGQLLLALAQTAASTDRRLALHTGDETSRVDLGSFVDVLHGRDPKAELGFSLAWSLPEPRVVRDPLSPTQTFAGTELRLESVLAADAHAQPSVRRFRYELRDRDAVTLHAELTQSAEGEAALSASPIRLALAEDRAWPLEAPEKFYRVSERSLARYRNADFLADFALEVERCLGGLSHLGPLRERPRRVHAWTGHAPPDVGARGEDAIACVLAADAAKRTLRRGPRGKSEPFGAFIARWLVELGVVASFNLRKAPRGSGDHEVRVTTLGGLTDVALPDVGFGVSQVLPVLVQAFYGAPGSTAWIEQPELHLHPQVQSELADVFIAAIRAHEHGRPRGVQLVVETHSEHFLSRLQRRIAEGALAPEEVALHVARPGARGSELEELTLDEFGDIANWPERFFGDEMAELFARTEAAARRRAARRPR